MYVCVYVCKYIYIYIYTHTRTHAHTHTHTHTRTHRCACTQAGSDVYLFDPQFGDGEETAVTELMQRGKEAAAESKSKAAEGKKELVTWVDGGRFPSQFGFFDVCELLRGCVRRSLFTLYVS